ncbi:MAG: HAMP domain-containing histidine kinase [Firmicutes bacterium]|nr:HAMP domain-containing histidine kinase [Bacillota bacterium]
MFRNKEFRLFAVLLSLLAIFLVTLGFYISAAAGTIAVLSALFFTAAFFAFTKDRYDSISQISNEIDHVLHNDDHVFISESEEGELSILQNEITKMTLRIREQNDALKREKTHLADSLADIAHQLRTPLTSANLIISLLKNDPEECERKILLREAEDLFVQVDWLLTSLLKLSRLDAGIVVFQNERVYIKNLIDSALRPFLILMELRNINIRTDIPEKAAVYGDFNWISEAIQNIIKNCIENAGNNGDIEIICEDNQLFTEIIIHDSGAGFEKADMPYLFDRFYRGKNTYTAGYGIGLALCKTIIKRQGGTVTAKNHPEGGAVFFIRFTK